jgi:hypothetical protein
LDNTTGKKRLARIDKDDAAQILADKKRMDFLSNRKAQLQAEWDKIEKEMVEGDGSKS